MVIELFEMKDIIPLLDSNRTKSDMEMRESMNLLSSYKENKISSIEIRKTVYNNKDLLCNPLFLANKD